MESVFLEIPIFGRIYRHSLLCKLTDAMALLIGAGCDIPEALRLSAGATGSEKLKREAELAALQTEQGANILEAGQLGRLIPKMFYYSVQLGSQRNELQDNLYTLSDMYSQQVRASQTRLSAVLLPIMLVIVGGILALAIMAMFAPMVNMIECLS